MFLYDVMFYYSTLHRRLLSYRKHSMTHIDAGWIELVEWTGAQYAIVGYASNIWV